MTRLRPRAWLGLALLALLAFGFTTFVGAWAGGKDIDETCAAAGQTLDERYRAQHWQEPGRFFPMHNRCNADYDLVPGWVNPALVIFAVIAVACLVGAAAASTPAGNPPMTIPPPTRPPSRRPLLGSTAPEEAQRAGVLTEGQVAPPGRGSPARSLSGSAGSVMRRERP